MAGQSGKRRRKRFRRVRGSFQAHGKPLKNDGMDPGHGGRSPCLLPPPEDHHAAGKGQPDPIPHEGNQGSVVDWGDSVIIFSGIFYLNHVGEEGLQPPLTS